MMPNLTSAVHQFCAEERGVLVDALVRLCEIPSISGSPAHHEDVIRCARAVADEALACGFTSAELVGTDGHPVVVAEYLSQDPSAPWVLIYTHYDVQPADRSQPWTTPPFEPRVRGGAVYARGAADDKGHIVMHLHGVRALLESFGELPVNLVFVSEGEEEIGSTHFGAFLEGFGRLSDIDAIVVSDTPGFTNGRATICTSLRGLVVAEVAVQSADRDAHSGMFGGAVSSAVEELARLLGSLKCEETGRVLIDHFYDGVRTLSPEGRAALDAVPFDEASWLDVIGSRAPKGEDGRTSLERVWYRPTLDINAFEAGDATAELNTIIPARATARISCRLVEGQQAGRIASLLRTTLRDRCPADLSLEVNARAVADPVSLGHPALTAAVSDAVARVLGEAPIPVGMGGSVPPVATLASSGIPCVLLGMATDADNFHSGDEHFAVDRLVRGVEIAASLWTELPGALSQE